MSDTTLPIVIVSPWVPIAEAPDGPLDGGFCGMYVNGRAWINYATCSLTREQMMELGWTHFCAVKLPDPPQKPEEK